MTSAGWLPAVCLVVAGLLLWWPDGARRTRRRLAVSAPARAIRTAPRRAGRRLPNLPAGRTVLAVAGMTALACGAAGGPVAAIAGAAYGGLAAAGLLRRRSARAAAGERIRQLDHLCGLAADLRAGLPASAANVPAHGAPAGPSLAGEEELSGHDRVFALARAAWHLAEQTGAPLAELIERIEADARAMDRALAAAAAQAAGARATAWLLAGLPLGGMALGYAIGVDPLRVLLHTPIGAGCALGAVVLQLAGLVWAQRLSRVPGPQL